jgi:hypothetical protein
LGKRRLFCLISRQFDDEKEKKSIGQLYQVFRYSLWTCKGKYGPGYWNSEK